MAGMRSGIVMLLVVWLGGCAGFGGHEDLVVADRETGEAIRPGSLRVTYLGCNGYLLESAGAAVLVDPYFSRVGLCRVALGLEIAPRRERVEAALDELPRESLRDKLRAVLVTHGHFDHLMDVPMIVQAFGAPVVGSPTSCFLAQAAGVGEGRTVPVAVGDERGWAGVDVRMLGASHDRVLFGDVPYEGRLEAEPEAAPRKAGDWLLGRPLAYVIEMDGVRVYVDSGGTGRVPPPEGVGPVDLAILGVATDDSRERLPAALRRLRPRYVLPSHQDDFFRDWRDGFHFSVLADMDAVRQMHGRVVEPAGRLILLGYFRPWTLPPAAEGRS